MGRVSLSELESHVKEASTQFGVPEEHIWNVIRAENSGSAKGAQKLTSADPNAVSPKGARGVMQVTKPAYDDVVQSGLVPAGLDLSKLTVAQQVHIGTAYLSKLMKLSDKPAEIYAMYNYGPKARFRMDQLPAETRGYLEKTGSSSSTRTSESTVTRTPVVPPTDLARALLQSNADATIEMQNTAMMLEALGQKEVAQSQAAIAGQRSILDAGLEIKNAQFEVQYQNDLMAQRMQALLGVDPADMNSEIARSVSDLNSAQKAYSGARAEYDQLAQTDLMSDPIGYIFAQLKLPSAAARVNAFVDQGENAIGNVKSRLDMLRMIKSNVTANTLDETRKLNQELAANEVALAKAKLDGEDAKIFSQQAAVEMRRLQVTNMMADNTRGTLTTIATLEDRDEARALREEQLKELRNKKMSSEEEDKLMDGRLAIVSKTIGLNPPMTAKQLKALADSGTKDAWYRAAVSGQFGPDLAESLAFFSSYASRKGMVAGANAGMIVTADKLKAAAEAEQSVVQAALFAKTGKQLSPDKLEQAAFQTYERRIVDAVSKPGNKNDMADPYWDRNYNPYRPDFALFNNAIQVHPKLQLLKDNVLTKALGIISESVSASGGSLSADNMQQALRAVEAQVQARQITPERAASDITAYVSGAVSYNRALNKYEHFALPAPNKYYFTLTGDTKRQVDLMNFAAVENALSARIRESAKKVFGTKGGPVFGDPEAARIMGIPQAGDR